MPGEPDRERARQWLQEALGPKPTAVSPAPARSLAADVKASRDWIVAIAVELLESADSHSRAVTLLLDKVAVLTVCAGLPGDMPLRIRCTPNVFRLKA